MKVKINGPPVLALQDTGASMCYICSTLAKQLGLRVNPSTHQAVMAAAMLVKAEGELVANLQMNE